jgi:hypothetical protein
MNSEDYPLCCATKTGNHQKREVGKEDESYFLGFTRDFAIVKEKELLKQFLSAKFLHSKSDYRIRKSLVRYGKQEHRHFITARRPGGTDVKLTFPGIQFCLVRTDFD